MGGNVILSFTGNKSDAASADRLQNKAHKNKMKPTSMWTKQPEALLWHEFYNWKLYSKKLKCGRKGPRTPSRAERTHGTSGTPGAQDAREPGQ